MSTRDNLQGIRQLSLTLSVFITLALVLVVSLITYFLDLQISFIHIFIIGLVVFFSAFAVNFFYLERFVYERLKNIYKIINSSKLGGNPNLSSTDFYRSKSIDQVNKEVVDWANKTATELESMKALEVYRKQFVGDISHELKTPLFSIQGYLITLLEGGMYDEKVFKKYLSKASANADRLQNIVEDLEFISNLEYNAPNFIKKPFKLKQLIDEVISDVELQGKDKNITFAYKPKSLESATVYADKEAIRQVLNNLSVNSIKYGVDNGVTKFGIFDMDTKILVEVSDDGIGIDEKDHKHVFDRFYRVDRSRNREIGGSGLGLSIVKHIIEGHQQQLSLRSTLGVGSTFGFTLDKYASS